jgi:two-component system CheB/CheR fusion protein
MHPAHSRLLVLEARFERLVHSRAHAIQHVQRHARGHAPEAVAECKSEREIEHDAEQSFREALKALPAAIYTTDAAGRITSFNSSAADLWGQSPELGKSQWCGSWKLYRLDEQPLPHDVCPMAVALKEDRQVRGERAIAERPDGRRVPFMAYPTPLHDASGALVGAVNMLLDITGRDDELASGRRSRPNTRRRANRLKTRATDDKVT